MGSKGNSWRKLSVPHAVTEDTFQICGTHSGEGVPLSEESEMILRTDQGDRQRTRSTEQIQSHEDRQCLPGILHNLSTAAGGVTGVILENEVGVRERARPHLKMSLFVAGH